MNSFRVATTFEVEDTSVRPAVFVITDYLRLGSAERVVLPVPDKPKNTAVS